MEEKNNCIVKKWRKHTVACQTEGALECNFGTFHRALDLQIHKHLVKGAKVAATSKHLVRINVLSEKN